MRIRQTFALVPLAFFGGSVLAPGADPCQAVNTTSLASYRTMLGGALASARADAQANGATGKYAVAATNARDLLQRSYDRATQMVNFYQQSTPNNTSYAEASHIKAYLQSILAWLPDAAHWATISAVYHRSRRAVDAFDRATAAIEQGGRLMAEAGNCYMAPYLAGSATPG